MNTAAAGFKDWQAYVDAGQHDEASIAFDTFSHEIDVARESEMAAQSCTDESLLDQFVALDLHREHVDYLRATDNAELQRSVISVEKTSLGVLWSGGYAKTHRADYVYLKTLVVFDCKDAGVELRSPESGKVIVVARPTHPLSAPSP